jgi:DNA-binding beta-propeller fold protein YncE
MFKRPEIMRVPAAGGEATKLAELPRAVLALHGGTLYAASYATGVLVAIETATGKSRVVARGLGKPTAIAADATYVYASCEADGTLRRIDAATGATTELARGLVNSDDVELDGDHVYTRTWGARPALVRVAKDGSRPRELVAELPTPTDIAFDAAGVYVTSRDGRQIIRLEKAALGSR